MSVAELHAGVLQGLRSGAERDALALLIASLDIADLTAEIALCFIGLILIFNTKFFSAFSLFGIAMVGLFGLIVYSNSQYNSNTYS